MIINTGARTDTVQWYTPWLLKRFEEGYVLVRNPLFPNKVTCYELTPEVVDVVEFCSKNYAPILSHLRKITDRFNTHFHYTITAYGPDIEPRVPSIDKSIDTLYQLEEIVGAKRICWRYDPVLLTRDYTIERHFATFEHICTRLAGHVDRCIFFICGTVQETAIQYVRTYSAHQRRHGSTGERVGAHRCRSAYSATNLRHRR